jgi:hypothetical protein
LRRFLIPLILTCILLAPTVLAAPKKAAKPAPEPESLFSEAVDFSKELPDLQMAAEKGDENAIPRDKLLMVDGTLRSITVRSENPSSFIAEAEIVSGAWKGLEKVEFYRCYVIFQGPEYAAIFSKNALPENHIPLSTRILVIGRYVGLAEDYAGNGTVAVLKAYKIRRLD